MSMARRCGDKGLHFVCVPKSCLTADRGVSDQPDGSDPCPSRVCLGLRFAGRPASVQIELSVATGPSDAQRTRHGGDSTLAGEKVKSDLSKR
jgi:hypothetical protein